MFACNGKTATKTCLLHIYTIHQLWTQDSNQYNCNYPLTKYVLPFLSQWNVPCTPLYLMSDTKVIVLWLKRWVIPNDTQPENLVKPDEEFRTLQTLHVHYLFTESTMLHGYLIMMIFNQFNLALAVSTTCNEIFLNPKFFLHLEKGVKDVHERSPVKENNQ